VVLISFNTHMARFTQDLSSKGYIDVLLLKLSSLPTIGTQDQHAVFLVLQEVQRLSD
jgi:hypothetical protein